MSEMAPHRGLEHQHCEAAAVTSYNAQSINSSCTSLSAAKLSCNGETVASAQSPPWIFHYLDVCCAAVCHKLRFVSTFCSNINLINASLITGAFMLLCFCFSVFFFFFCGVCCYEQNSRRRQTFIKYAAINVWCLIFSLRREKRKATKWSRSSKLAPTAAQNYNIITSNQRKGYWSLLDLHSQIDNAFKTSHYGLCLEWAGPYSPPPAKSFSVNTFDSDLSQKSSLMMIPSCWNNSLLSDQTVQKNREKPRLSASSKVWVTSHLETFTARWSWTVLLCSSLEVTEQRPNHFRWL